MNQIHFNQITLTEYGFHFIWMVPLTHSVYYKSRCTYISTNSH